MRALLLPSKLHCRWVRPKRRTDRPNAQCSPVSLMKRSFSRSSTRWRAPGAFDSTRRASAVGIGRSSAGDSPSRSLRPKGRRQSGPKGLLGAGSSRPGLQELRVVTQCDRRVRSGHRLPDECNGLERGTARRHEGYPTLSLDETRDVRAAIESVLQVDPIALNRDSHRTPQKASEDNQSADGTKDQGSSVIHARQLAALRGCVSLEILDLVPAMLGKAQVAEALQQVCETDGPTPPPAMTRAPVTPWSRTALDGPGFVITAARLRSLETDADQRERTEADGSTPTPSEFKSPLRHQQCPVTGRLSRERKGRVVRTHARGGCGVQRLHDRTRSRRPVRHRSGPRGQHPHPVALSA